VKPSLPEAALQQHIAVLGKTGSGKSSVMRGIVESLLDQGKPVSLIDPKGDWWGLKSSADGKHAGYPVVIFGGPHADVAIDEHSGAHVAELLATGNRPCVIDLGTWMVGERTRFFIAFASSLFKHARGMRWLVMDEVHNFAPQGKILDPDAGKMLHWANRLASEGRGKGIQIIAASQRPQKVHKDLLDSCETLIAMRSVHPRARAAIKEWLDGAGDTSKASEIMAELAAMPRGTGWVWSPEIGFGPKKIAFPLFKTYDSFKPSPEGDERLKGWAEVDLDEVKTKLAAVVKVAQENDPKILRARIRELEKAKGAAVDVEALSKRDLEQAEVRGRMAGRDEVLNAIYPVRQALNKASVQCALAADLLAGAEKGLEITLPPLDTVARVPVRSAPPPQRASVGHGTGNPEVGTGGLQRILIALAQRPQGLTARQLGVRAGLSSRSGTFATYLSKGRSEGWILGSGSQALRITDAGLKALGTYEPLPTGAELLRYWLNELDAGAARILKAIAEAYPKALTRDQVGERANLSPASGTFATYLSKLRTLELISGSGELSASDELFD
jgi:hypothetical protein